MSSNSEHIDIELLRRYYNNELSDTARHELEKQALNDPFLKDAMDGFDENPGSFNQFYEANKGKFRSKKSYTVLTAVGIIIALFVVTALIKKYDGIDNEHLAQNDTDSLIGIDTTQFNPELLAEEVLEFEMIPAAIETLSVIAQADIVTPNEVVNHQELVAEIINEQEEPIIINEDFSHEEDLSIQDESAHWHKHGQITTETSYLFDLMVVDYRKITRENEKITYKRFELSGVSADQEDGVKNEDDLIEREVKVPYYDYLRKSMSFFAEGRYKKALNRYLLILDQYPDDLNALFYGALSYHNLGKNTEAIVFFDKIINGELYVFSEEALWYKAKALIKLKKKVEAKAILEEIIAHGGFYTQEAIALREKL
ncbi:MAG: tetratricopeptide (TPR) repeat protein [Crocinitomix sp.]|jgi:tetratricopeptide (TPR) repeat protein